MRLDDIDWRAGELVVHGKGGRDDRLPLPGDVGQALVDYLVHERRRSPLRAVFLRATARRVPMSRNAVVMVSRTASRRAGLPVVGGHRLRHTAATSMLRAGASLREVGQVLRHRDEATTAIYAKVDQAALALLARPWPEADPMSAAGRPRGRLPGDAPRAGLPAGRARAAAHRPRRRRQRPRRGARLTVDAVLAWAVAGGTVSRGPGRAAAVGARRFAAYLAAFDPGDRGAAGESAARRRLRRHAVHLHPGRR